MDPRSGTYYGQSEDSHQERYRTGTRQQETPRFTPDDDFWYWDGNVIILMGDVGFKLHASRLANYCGYFHELFSVPGRLTGPALAGQLEAEGCRVYHVPHELSMRSFKHLLSALESPLEFVSNPPSQELAISLLFAADILSCDLVLDVAKERLSKIWDSVALPAPEGSDAEDRTYASAIRAIQIARTYSIPGILRRAFYELLSSHAFWEVLERTGAPRAILAALQVSEDDVRMLLMARVKLGEIWRTFVLQVPEGRTFGSSHRRHWQGDTLWCCHYDEKMRAAEWWSFVIEKGALEVLDPLRFDFMAEWGEELQNAGRWCAECVGKKRKAAAEKRTELWERMDELFGL